MQKFNEKIQIWIGKLVNNFYSYTIKLWNNALSGPE